LRAAGIANASGRETSKLVGKGRTGGGWVASHGCRQVGFGGRPRLTRSAGPPYPPRSPRKINPSASAASRRSRPPDRC
jgi:hypothetical protein